MSVEAENVKVTFQHDPRLELWRFYSSKTMKRWVLDGRPRANLPLQAIYKLYA
jgi:hypothetical protein